MADHRHEQSPVRNQGDRPTCVGFAVSSAHDWIRAGESEMSAEDAMWAGHQIASFPGSSATTVRYSLEGLARHRHAIEAAWPYGNPRCEVGRPPAAQDIDHQRNLPTWRTLSKLTIDAIDQEIESGHAVVVSFHVDMPAWREPPLALIDADPGKTTTGIHAVLAVGTAGRPAALIIKNSWGTGWGDDGYGYVTERYVERYTLRAFALER